LFETHLKETSSRIYSKNLQRKYIMKSLTL